MTTPREIFDNAKRQRRDYWEAYHNAVDELEESGKSYEDIDREWTRLYRLLSVQLLNVRMIAAMQIAEHCPLLARALWGSTEQGAMYIFLDLPARILDDPPQTVKDWDDIAKQNRWCGTYRNGRNAALAVPEGLF